MKMVASAYELDTKTEYTVTERLYRGSRTEVYRALRQAEGEKVILKVLRQQNPSLKELVQFRNQYTISYYLDHPGILSPLALERHKNSYLLVLPDEGLISLPAYIRQYRAAAKLPLILKIALQLADVLRYLGEQRVIHKDIKPTNILIQPETEQIKLIDFSIASLLPKENTLFASPSVLEGTLAYIAPEQTGRMNRGIDYRTDYYSLGATLFELLAGSLPFDAEDPLELIHCHIARPVIFPEESKPEIPETVSAIIGKLMAKNAEDRYQSALGLKHDLEQCLQQWTETKDIPAFELGSRDICDRFSIPEKLYGRETEVRALLAAFDRVARGASELMLMAGISGIGKTAAVNEVHKPIVRQRGYFIKGKFDQFNRNIPFSAFVQAFRDLVEQLFGESDAQLRAWKTQILEALGDNAQVIVDLIPALEGIIGPQPPAPELSGTAAQNRFNLLFQKFIQVFATAEHPLVIFVDDLQWADSASLNLVQLLVAEAQTGYLLLLGAYRDNEVFPAHPLMSAIGAMAKAQARIETITLQPLSANSLNCLIADTLHAPAAVTQPLAELVMQKTQGNPFFATQFLKALHQEELLVFNREAGHWQGDMVQIQEAALNDDVVEFMASQLQKLPDETQDILKLAACIGARFDLQALAIVCEKPQSEVASLLWKALQEGLILPTSQVYKFFQNAETLLENSSANPGYRFLHDRVQQAAYSLIASDRKAITHWCIGSLMWQEGLDRQEGKLFDLVNQLNLGRSAISQPEQRQQLAQLNLQAAEKAKLSAAYQATQTYCTTGIELLSSEAWQTDYKLTYGLHHLGAEAAYLSGNFDRAEQLYEVVLQQAQTPLDRAMIYRVQMTQYKLQGRNSEAITIQRQSLELLGCPLPVEPDRIQACLDAEIAKVREFLSRQSIESILDLPEMTDPNWQEILRILQILFYAAWLDNQIALASLAVTKMTTLSLQYGNSEMSPFGYVAYGMIVIALLKDATQAYEFGHMAVRLCDRFDRPDVRGMTNFLFAGDVHSWNRPLRAADRHYEEAYKYGMDAGNWLTVSLMAIQSGSDRLTYGRQLDELYAIVRGHAAFLQKIKSLENLDVLVAGVLQPVRQLLGLTKTPLSLDDASFSEAEYLQKYRDSQFHLAWLYSVKIRHAYLFGCVDLYLELIPKADLVEEAVPSHAKVPSTTFYTLLMHLSLIEQASCEERVSQHWQAVKALEAKLGRWQQDCPENIQHKCLLVQAEKARLQGDIVGAIDGYDRSIECARAQQYGYEAALANELAAKFYLGWGKEKIAASYMQEAYYDYIHWGAQAKVTQLEQEYPDLLLSIFESQKREREDTANYISSQITLRTTSISDNLDGLDLLAIVKASQAISQEFEWEQLLSTLMQNVAAMAGAQVAQLILKQDDRWTVVAKTDGNHTQLSQTPLNAVVDLPQSLLRRVLRTQETVLYDDLDAIAEWAADPYVLKTHPKSVFCTTLTQKRELIGAIYLENNISVGAFNRDRAETVKLLMAQAVISLEISKLYHQQENYSQVLELEVAEKTEALQQKTQDLQQALEDLQATNEVLLRATQLKDEFLANMSHELRTPLNAILGLTEALQEEIYGSLNPKQQNVLTTVSQSGTHLLDLINDILDLAKVESGKVELTFGNISADRICSTSLNFIKQQAYQKQIQIDVRIAPQLPILMADARRIRQVLINLLSNAVKFTAQGGSIVVCVTQEDEPSALVPAGDRPQQPDTTPSCSRWIRFTVIDTGIGIAPENIQKLFQPFVQIDSALNRQYCGTGLGLSLVKNIVELHGGRVGVSSQEGIGSQFWFDLPERNPSEEELPVARTCSEETRQISASNNTVPTAQSHSYRILLAEDNQANVETVSAYLEAKGHTIVLARDGWEAISQVQAERPDIILMDIQMPGIDGMEAIRRIRKIPEFINLPIIALTAMAMRGDREKCVEAGATDYISKPVRLQQLRKKIQQFLEVEKSH